MDRGQNQDWFLLLLSCSHSGNSSNLSTHSGRVKLLKVTGGIRGQDWCLTHYAMMLRGKCDGNSEMQSFHNAANKEVMKSVMTVEQLTLLLLNRIYNLLSKSLNKCVKKRTKEVPPLSWLCRATYQERTWRGAGSVRAVKGGHTSRPTPRVSVGNWRREEGKENMRGWRGVT